jgi:large conductance mechanosensitive channel
MSFFADFQKFAFKGNVVDLAVGVVIGGAFGKIVSALVADLIMPLVALVMPSGDWRASGILLRAAADPKDNVLLKYGDLLGAIIDFLIVALVLFILISRVIKLAEGKLLKSKPPEAPTTKECTFCLEKIPLQATKCRACTSSVS